MAAIAFIGLGLMGAGFTKRLVAKGHDVIGVDVAPERVREAAAWGVRAAATPAEAAREAELIFICVTTTQAMETVVAGPDGLTGSGAVDGKTVIDLSTCEIDATKRMADALVERGAAFLDAPVSGGPTAAETGGLAIMVGGDTTAVDGARPVLEMLGRATHMGPVGAGQATKLVNQALCLTNYCVVAEGLRIAEAFGVDAAKIPTALEPGLANSAVLQAVYPRMVNRDYAPRGYARQVLKDFEMLIAATRSKQIALPMSFQAAMLFRMLVGQGKGELDGSAVAELIPEIASPER
jgi:3-hydroxyisobutyrate dehydrogenase-like beta-hydroxyacid dehydrogenase